MITKDMGPEEIDFYITNALFDVLENRREDLLDNVKLDRWEPYERDIDNLVNDFVKTYFKYNKYREGSYNNNWLVDVIYKGYTENSHMMEYINYVIYAAAASLIVTCHQFTDIEEVTGMNDGHSIYEVISEFTYKYLTWAFASPRDKSIDWNIFNKKTSLYGDVVKE